MSSKIGPPFFRTFKTLFISGYPLVGGEIKVAWDIDGKPWFCKSQFAAALLMTTAKMNPFIRPDEAFVHTARVTYLTWPACLRIMQEAREWDDEDILQVLSVLEVDVEPWSLKIKIPNPFWKSSVDTIVEETDLPMKKRPRDQDDDDVVQKLAAELKQARHTIEELQNNMQVAVDVAARKARVEMLVKTRKEVIIDLC
jgi:hypothetical protein